MKHRVFVLSFLVWLLGLSGVGHSFAAKEPPLITDRPDFTESSEVVPSGYFQLEAGTTFSWGAKDGASLAVGELLARIGLGRISELRLGINSYSLGFGSTLTHGMEDSRLGFKIKLVNGKGVIPDLAWIVDTSLPTGSASAGGSVALQPGFKLCLAWSLTSALSLGINLNYGWVLDGFRRMHELSYSASFGFSLSEVLGMYAEYYGFVVLEGSTSHFLNGGLTYRLNSSTQLDARVGGGLDQGNPALFVGVGFTWRK